MMRILFIVFLIFPSFVLARPTVSANGMVVSVSSEASRAGVEILKKGGNAADAAVATAFVLAVSKAYYGSLGGGGFMMIKFKNSQVEALDYRERAPLQSSSDMFAKSTKQDTSITGGLAVATPGVVAGLVALHEKYGKLPWSKVVAPAIELAKKGIVISHEWVSITEGETKRFSPAAFVHYTNSTKKIPQVGAVLKQPGLARALELIQKRKNKGFYEGKVAEDLVKTVQKEGGILSPDDLKGYKVKWRSPIMKTFKGRKIFLMPPPSSGGVVISQLLALSEKFNLPSLSPMSAQEFHLMGEFMARAFSDRQILGDPEFNKLPMDTLLSQKHVDDWADTISTSKKTAVDVTAAPLTEGENTTHYAVIDKDGNAVSSTTTVNTNYGSGVVTQIYGINMNNCMDDFTTKPGQPNVFGLTQGEQNKVEPLKTPLSSMSPTIVLNEKGEVELAIGSPGGPRIISAVYQTVYRSMTTDWDIDQIIQAPRVHHQFMPDKLYHDAWGHSPDTLTLLTKKGHSLEAAKIARVYGIRRMKSGLLEGAYDGRGEGEASGY